MSQRNDGIIMKDDARIAASQVTVGPHASSSIVGSSHNGPGIAEVQEKLERVLGAISREQASLDKPDEISQSARLVVKEATAATPNRITIHSVLDGLCSAVKSATGVATAMEALKLAVLHLVG
jgi:hypothetical protein